MHQKKNSDNRSDKIKISELQFASYGEIMPLSTIEEGNYVYLSVLLTAVI
jgi:hypothetical protein